LAGQANRKNQIKADAERKLKMTDEKEEEVNNLEPAKD
jgi:hypothetical protein